MRMFIGLLLVLSLPALGQVQERAEPKVRPHFRLDFAIKQLDAGKLVDTRNFFVIAALGDVNHNAIRSGSRLPYATSAEGNQYNFAETGASLDLRVLAQQDNMLELEVTAEISSLVLPKELPRYPTTRQNRWAANVVVPIGKPTVIFSSDSLESKNNIQVELLASPVR